MSDLTYGNPPDWSALVDEHDQLTPEERRQHQRARVHEEDPSRASGRPQERRSPPSPYPGMPRSPERPSGAHSAKIERRPELRDLVQRPYNSIPVLDHGYLKFIESWGSDERIIQKRLADTQREVYAEYDALIKIYGLSKEIARLNTPVSRYSRMRASANLRNWLAFLTLRMDAAAQEEIRLYAVAVGRLIWERFPRTWGLFAEGLSRG